MVRRDDRVPRAIGRSKNIGGHWGNINLRHFEVIGFAFIPIEIWGIRLPALPSGPTALVPKPSHSGNFFPSGRPFSYLLFSEIIL